MKGFGARLRLLREKRRLSQNDLANMVGIHLSQLGRIERGTCLPSAETVLALARALRATTDALLRGDHAGEESIQIQNVRLYERFRALEGMSRGDQDAIIRVLDAMIAKQRVESALIAP